MRGILITRFFSSDSIDAMYFPCNSVLLNISQKNKLIDKTDKNDDTQETQKRVSANSTVAFIV